MKFPIHPGDILTERRPAEASAAPLAFLEMGLLRGDTAHLDVNNPGHQRFHLYEQVCVNGLG